MNGSLSLTVETSSNRINVVGTGVWTAEQAHAHFERLAGALHEIHARGGVARVLVDLREAAPQPPEVGEVISTVPPAIYGPGDRAAIVVSTNDQHIQMDRLTVSLNSRIFDDPVAAIRWLSGGEQGNI